MGPDTGDAGHYRGEWWSDSPALAVPFGTMSHQCINTQVKKLRNHHCLGSPHFAHLMTLSSLISRVTAIQAFSVNHGLLFFRVSLLMYISLNSLENCRASTDSAHVDMARSPLFDEALHSREAMLNHKITGHLGLSEFVQSPLLVEYLWTGPESTMNM